MDEEKSFELRYVGARYDGGRLPVDVLSDLGAFRDLLVAFAKDDWKSRNTDRERVPKGFDKSLTFSLTSIEEGSARPQLQWDRDAAQAALPGFSHEIDEILENAYDKLLHLIETADQAANDISLSSSHVRALNKFGAKLRPGERIEFKQRSNASNVIYLDTSKRRTLITRVHETYQLRYESVGTFIGLNVHEQCIYVRTTDRGDIKIPIAHDRIIDEFDGKILSEIQFDLNLELDHHDNVKNVLDVYSAELIDANTGRNSEFFKELAEIARLEEGWLDGEGESISRTAIETTKLVLKSTEDLPANYKIFPTEQAGILLEFKQTDWAYSLEIAKSGSLHIVGVKIGSPENYESEIFEKFSKEFEVEMHTRILSV
ncbi:hypothetical protein DFO60_4835 [Ectopseudomonas oleovorans]|uniref:Uncharacterized protein n=2 Tax=Ectopseudomonas oleovorans TaxID=301 RepID=A0A3D9E730_ECTOL|nr:hypothetical protein DFO60_4835 [Pseudomonas oleovorans]